MTHLPFPPNNNELPQRLAEPSLAKPPWQRIKPGEMPPMMFQLRLHDGSRICYAYSDLRETRLRDSGQLQLLLWGLEKYQITIIGRLLDDLATEISLGRVRWLEESDPRAIDRPEDMAAIDEIQIEIMMAP